MAYKLLLADDSVTIQRVIELTFADEDVQVIAVGDGQQAIDRIDADPPDIILADIDMPKRDGYEVASYVKSRPKLAHIPVVLLTGAFEPIDQARATAVGSDAVLAKPFEPQMVINRVKQLLGKKVDGGAPKGQQAPPGVPAPPVATVRPGGPSSMAPPPLREVPEARLAAPEVVSAAAKKAMDTLLAEPNAPVESDHPSVSLDDYFDQLDAAFANLGSNNQAAAGEPKTGAPPAERDNFDWIKSPSQASADAAADDWNLDGIVKQSPSVDFLETAGHSAADTVQMPSVLPAAPMAPVSRAAQAPPAVHPVPREAPVRAEPERTVAHRVPDPPPAPPVVAPRPPQPQVSMPVVPPTPVAVPSPPPPMADAFAALLAAEQGERVTRASASPASSAAAGPVITEQLIEQVASRVLERLSDRVVRDTVAEMVSRVAERLVREEIERIKQGSK